MIAQSAAFTDGPLAIEENRFGDQVLVVSLAGELDAAVVPPAPRTA